MYKRLINHVRAGPARVSPNPLHIPAFHWFGVKSIDIVLYLKSTTWSSGSLDPSYNFMSGGLNFHGSSTEVMDSRNGVSKIVPARLLLMGSLIPGRLDFMASLSLSISFLMPMTICWASVSIRTLSVGGCSWEATLLKAPSRFVWRVGSKG